MFNHELIKVLNNYVGTNEILQNIDGINYLTVTIENSNSDLLNTAIVCIQSISLFEDSLVDIIYVISSDSISDMNKIIFNPINVFKSLDNYLVYKTYLLSNNENNNIYYQNNSQIAYNDTVEEIVKKIIQDIEDLNPMIKSAEI